MTNGMGYSVEGSYEDIQQMGLKKPVATGPGNKYYPPVPYMWLPGGGALIRWKLSWADIWKIVKSRSIWHLVGTGAHVLQPTHLFSECPVEFETATKVVTNEMDGMTTKKIVAETKLTVKATDKQELDRK